MPLRSAWVSASGVLVHDVSVKVAVVQMAGGHVEKVVSRIADWQLPSADLDENEQAICQLAIGNRQLEMVKQLC